MRGLNILTLRLRSLFRRKEVDGELDGELQFHLDQQIEENIAAGMTPKDARYAALRTTGSIARFRDECRDARRMNLIESIFKDLRLAARVLRRDFTFTLISALTLALGIGATTAIFTVVNAVILRPLPYNDPDRLVTLWETNPIYRYPNRFSPGNYLDLRDQSHSFQQIGGFASQNYNLTGLGEAERVAGGLVSGNLFSMLGIRPELGRVFVQGDDSYTAERTAILSHRLWIDRFGGDPAAIGKSVRLDDRNHTIVGVMPAGFELMNVSVDVWLPIERKIDPEQMHWRYSYYVAVIARLKPGVSLVQARQDVDRVMQSIRRDHPDDLGKGGTAESMLAQVAEPVRQPLLILMGAAGFVLLIACVNVANLNLAHTAARQREIKVRLALGASRGRVIRQLLTESLTLALVGGLAGALLAVGGVNLLLRAVPEEIPRASEIHVDLWLLVFTMLCSCAAAIAFGLFPAITSSNLQDSVRGSGGSSRRRAPSFLVISEVALALILMIGAGLMIESLRRVSAVNPGFDPQNLRAIRVSLAETKYPTIDREVAYFDQILARVRQMAGNARDVNSITAIDYLPFAPGGFDNSFAIDDRPKPPPGQHWIAHIRRVDPSFFAAMRTPLLAGRTFNDHDRANSSDVAIISQSLAQHYWPSANPIGKRLSVYFGNPQLHPEIVGVVSDVHNALDTEPREYIYVPYAQGRHITNMYVILRGNVADANTARAAMVALDPDQPVNRVQSMDELLVSSLAARRFETSLLGGFAACAVVLAAIGLYGVLALSVQGRTREIGVRTALGATASQVFGMVVCDAMRLALIGLIAGLAGAYALTRFLATLLYEVRPNDPVTFAVVSLLLMAVALAAGYFPARRAAKVDPMIALRHE
jgi:putative ABC transport system permease protein